jgi:propionyl-CoA carboxylase beta chain
MVVAVGAIVSMAVPLKAATGQTVDAESLGGARTHNKTSGVAHFLAGSDQDCIRDVRRLLSYLPSNNLEDPPAAPCDDPVDRKLPELHGVVPDNPNKGYDSKAIIRAMVDRGEFLEVHEKYARNLVVGFARMGGAVVGIVANQPNHLAGCLDCDASAKGARFVRFCDAFNVPLVTFVDVPGFLPGTGQEWGGIVKHGAKLLYAFAEATVPKVTVITRKAYGGAYDVMALAFAPPSAELAQALQVGNSCPIVLNLHSQVGDQFRRCGLTLAAELQIPARVTPGIGQQLVTAGTNTLHQHRNIVPAQHAAHLFFQGA